MSKRDRAKRPQPPDRDGNGEPGGSLPGNETAAKAKGPAVTGVNTHVATKRGFAGQLIEPGETVPAGVPIGSWMV